MKPNRRQTLQALGGIAAGSLVARPAFPDNASTLCNVLIVKSDEHNPKFSSVYGHPFVRTPHMDRLAARGVCFDNCYCPSPLCMPSRSAYMAGRRVHETQTYNNCNVMSYDLQSYGSRLQQQNVHSVHIGKTDSFAPADQLGFSEMILPGDRTPPGDRSVERDPLFIREGSASRADGYGIRNNPFRHDDRCTEVAIAWLEQNASSHPVPWTMEVNLVKPHFPHTVTESFWEMYPHGEDLPEHGPDALSANHPYARDLRDHFETDQFTEEQIRGLRRGYYGCVSYVDQQLGRIMEALEASGVADRTLVVYTSDHGEMLGKFGMWWKCSLYEDSVRVPLLVAGPGFPQGTRSLTPVDQFDLLRTVFSSTGAAYPASWEGLPLQTLVQDDPNRFAFSEYHGHGTRGSAFLVRRGEWKLIYNCAAPHQLFHLGDDPEELHNRVYDRPDVVSEFTDALYELCDPMEEQRRAEAFIQRQMVAMGLK